MKTVRQVLDDKGSEIYDIGPDAMVIRGARRDGEPERRRVVGAGRRRSRRSDLGARLCPKGDPQGQSVEAHSGERDHDLPGGVCCSRSRSVDACMALMTNKRIRHLAVLEDDRLDRRCLDRRCRQGDHGPPAVHHRAARGLHHERALTIRRTTIHRMNCGGASEAPIHRRRPQDFWEIGAIARFGGCVISAIESRALKGTPTEFWAPDLRVGGSFTNRDQTEQSHFERRVGKTAVWDRSARPTRRRNSSDELLYDSRL